MVEKASYERRTWRMKKKIILVICLMMLVPSIVSAQSKTETDLQAKKTTLFVIGGVLIGVSLGTAVVTTFQKKKKIS